MLTDYVPESLARGGMVALGAPAATALALLVGLQNVPEGFNANRELTAASRRPSWVLAMMAAMALIGPAIGSLGWVWGSPVGLSAVMLFASGGILYLVFQDIAPQAHLERHWAPAFGAVLGFGLGLIGKMLVPEP
jgi:ZIP family zinc transporter